MTENESSSRKRTTTETADDSTQPASSTGIWVAVLGILVVAFGVGGIVMASRRSGSPDELFEKGLAALKQKSYQEVQVVATELEENHADYRSHVFYLRGAAKLSIGLRREAILDLVEAASNELLRVDAMILSGEALARLNEYTEAIDILQQALALEPQNVNGHRWLGVIAFDTGAMDQAMRHLEEVSKLAPEDARPHRLMGLILKDFEKYHEAIIHYEEAIRRDPYMAELDEVRYELALSLTELFRYQNALTILDKTRPTSNALYLRAKCLRAQNLENANKQAFMALQEATKQNSRNLDAQVLLGTILLEEKRIDAAIKRLELAVEIAPKADIPRYRLAEAYREKGDVAKAEEHLAIYKPLRELRLKYSKLNVDAIQEPTNIELRYNLGQLAIELDKPKLAKMWFQSVLAVDATHVKAQEAMAKLPANIVAAPVTTKLNVEPIKPVGNGVEAGNPETAKGPADNSSTTDKQDSKDKPTSRDTTNSDTKPKEQSEAAKEVRKK